jgi:ABC-type sugar transport system substrate-binding protein
MLYKEQRETIMTKKGVTTMRKSSLFVLVFGSMMLAMSAAIAHAQERSCPVIRQPAPTLSPAEINLQKVDAEFRRSIITEMQEATRQAGVKIRTDNFIAISFDDSGTVVVNAMIEGVDRVSIEQLAQGADVLFIFQVRSWALP